LETEFGGFFWGGGDGVGWSGRGLFEGFPFVVGHAADDFGRFGFEHLAAVDPVVRTQAELGGEGFRASEGTLDRLPVPSSLIGVPRREEPNPGKALKSTP